MDSNDDLKYQDIVKTLQKLQQVKAPAGFEADLMRRINSEESAGEKSVWHDLFVPSRLIPSAALAVTAILLIFVLDHSGVTQDNPLSTTPRERQDVTMSVKTDNASAEGKSLRTDEIAATQENPAVGADKDRVSGNGPAEETKQERMDIKVSGKEKPAVIAAGNDSYITAKFSTGRIADYPVNKEGLNFRQINLSNEQKIEINHLKEKLESAFKTKEKQ